MLRISRTSTGGRITFKLEGEVNGRWVEELRNEWHRTLSGDTDGEVVVDLANVSSIDAAGLELFREMAARCVAVTNRSLYVAELLKDVPSRDT
jgi:anti-anti-sigma factor